MTHVRTVHLRVPVADAELAVDLLFAAGASAVEERDLGGGHAVLVSDVTVDSAAALATAVGPWTFEVVDVDLAVVDAMWREHAEPVSVGRVVIAPSWKPAPESATTLLTIDSRAVFGSGTHPTTRHCLLALQQRLVPQSRVLDVGCGSGVLAIAAARLGAERVVAYDVDPEALAATRENAARNDVGHVIDVRSTLSGVEELFDVVVANIGAAALFELRDELVERVARRGALVLSGILESQADDVTTAYGLFVDARSVEDGWATLTLVRR